MSQTDVTTPPRARYQVEDFGAIADGKTDSTDAIQAAIDAAHAAGGGFVELNHGVYRAAALLLKSNVRLYVGVAAMLKANDDIKTYHRLGFRSGLLYARDAENLGVCGPGCLDGNGMHFADLTQRHHLCQDWKPQYTRQGDARISPPGASLEYGPYVMPDRPTVMLQFVRCKAVEVCDATIQNAPHWTMHFGDCDLVRFHDLIILNLKGIPNNDGVHFTGCRDVIIANNHIDCGDDCIAITGTQWDTHFFGDAYDSQRQANEYFTITNCVLRSRSSALRVGWGPLHNKHIRASNLTIGRSNRGIQLCARGGGNLEDISFSNITVEARLMHGHWWGLGEAIMVSSAPYTIAQRDLDQPESTGRIDHVRFDGIRCVCDNGVVVWSHNPGEISDVVFRDVQVVCEKGELEEHYGGNIDLRGNGHPEIQVFKADRYGMHLHNVHDVKLRDVDVTMDPNLPDYWLGGVFLDGCKDVDEQGLRVSTRGEGRELPKLTKA